MITQVHHETSHMNKNNFFLFLLIMGLNNLLEQFKLGSRLNLLVAYINQEYIQ